jgi:hypothetical protein
MEDGRQAMPEFDTNQLFTQAVATIHHLMHPLVAIEAYWDGDTSGWFLVVVALVDHPDWFRLRWTETNLPLRLHPRYEEQTLFILQAQGGDLRLFNGLAAPWLEAVAATVVGERLAQQFDVPFFFPSPHEPDDDCPHWWQQDQA